MTQIDSNAVVGWTTPELVRLGRIRDVAANLNTNTGQCNKNNCQS